MGAKRTKCLLHVVKILSIIGIYYLPEINTMVIFMKRQETIITCSIKKFQYIKLNIYKVLNEGNEMNQELHDFLFKPFHSQYLE